MVLITSGIADQPESTLPLRPAAEMNHVEAAILDRVALLFPETFTALGDFRLRHKNFCDPVVAQFDREVQFYLAWAVVHEIANAPEVVNILHRKLAQRGQIRRECRRRWRSSCSSGTPLQSSTFVHELARITGGSGDTPTKPRQGAHPSIRSGRKRQRFRRTPSPRGDTHTPILRGFPN